MDFLYFRHARDAERGHTRQGQPYALGAKAHLGVDAASGWVHRVTTTAANVADLTATGNRRHGAAAVLADAGDPGAEQRAALKDRQVIWSIAATRGQIAAWPDGEVNDLTLRIARLNAQARRRVAHVFHLIKDRGHPRQRRYQGLKKNGAQQEGLCARAHLIIAKPALLAA